MTANIQVSGKLPDGRIYVIGGDTADQFFDNLAGVLGNGETAQRVMEDFAVLVDPPSAQPSQPAVRSAPAQQAAPSAPGAPPCDHGPRSFRTGTKANGQAWSAWFCAAPKGAPDQCKPVWA